ncbi:MAG: hypothetical protein R2712_31745 [Vicinamibacterales bacterium]
MTRASAAAIVCVAVVAAAVMSVAAAPALAQGTRPRASVEALGPDGPVAPGASVTVRLAVTLPDAVHVQAHEPADPLLIPTVLGIEAPPGITIEAIAYPAPSELAQAGRATPLLVLGPRFSIEVRAAVSADASAGAIALPGVLRYQACTDEVCFPPARAAARWQIRVATP